MLGNDTAYFQQSPVLARLFDGGDEPVLLA
jgi:hypothetical protein